MKYKYQARTKQGEMQVGFVEAPNKDSAVNILSGHELYILTIQAAEKEGVVDRLSGYFGRVKRRDMVIFTRQLATLLEARLPLNTALKTLYEQTRQSALKEAAYRIAEDIDAGLSFSQSMERQSGIFSEFFINMVRASEVTGNLNEIMGFMADYIEKEADLVTKSRSAMIYPGIVIGLFVIVAIIMVTVVFPQLKPVFEQSAVELPILTRILIGSGGFFTKWWPLLLLGVTVIFIAAADYFRSEEGRALWDDFKVRAPIIKRVYTPVMVARFSNAGAILLRGGVPLAQAMEIVSHTVDNVLYQELFREIAEEIRQGTPLSDAINRHPTYFPPLVSQMLVVGESTGQLEKIFDRLATFYGREADNAVANVVDLIQPLLMIGVGLMVGLLFAAVLLPLYKLTSSFG